MGKHPSLWGGGTNFGKKFFLGGEPKESAILGGESQKTAKFGGEPKDFGFKISLRGGDYFALDIYRYGLLRGNSQSKFFLGGPIPIVSV